MTIRKIHYIAIYRHTLNIIITDNPKEALDKYFKNFDFDNNVLQGYEAFHAFREDKPHTSYILLPSTASTDTLAHESFHCAVHIMNIIGATLDKSSEESYAYLLGLIVDLVVMATIEFQNKNNK